jgi:hypothetical protein
VLRFIEYRRRKARWNQFIEKKGDDVILRMNRVAAKTHSLKKSIKQSDKGQVTPLDIK